MNILTRIKRKIKRIINPPKSLEQIKEETAIKSVMKKTGWDRETVSAKIKAAHVAVGISYTDYNINNFYKYDESQWKSEYARIISEQEDLKIKKGTDFQKVRDEISKVTGWSEEEVKAHYNEAKERTGCAWIEYYKYEFYNKTPEQQESLFLMVHSKQLAEKFLPERRTRGILCNKKWTNEVFEDYLNRAWCFNTTTDLETFRKIFKDSNRIIYKPLNGNKGFGIKAYRLDASSVEAVYQELHELSDGVVEEFVTQHPDMNKLTDASVNTVRIVTISDKDKPIDTEGNHFAIVYAALRIGGGNSIVDNFSSGGMTAAINLETGTVTTEGVDVSRNKFAKHPVTGTDIIGFKIPFFKEALAMVQEAAEKTKTYGYLGWDVAISDKGPALIEVNLRPGASLLSAPYSAHNMDSLHIMEKYL